MKNKLRRWKKDKKRREDFLKNKHLQSQQRDGVTETEKSMGLNHVMVMVGMVIIVLGFILYRMR